MNGPSFHHTSPAATPIFLCRFSLPPLFSAPFFHLPALPLSSLLYLPVVVTSEPIQHQLCNLNRDRQKSWDRCWNEGIYIHLSPVTLPFSAFQEKPKIQYLSPAFFHLMLLHVLSPPPRVSPLSIVLSGLSHRMSHRQLRFHSVGNWTRHTHCTSTPPLCTSTPTVRRKKQAHKWKHTCIQAKYENTVCKFCFCMQMWDHAAQTQM